MILCFLDDDDWWEHDHLSAVATAASDGAEVVATPLVRHDVQTPNGRVHTPPEVLEPSDFLAGNPGIQGSNLTVRLSALLLVGGFEEALTSCTDRDMCIRLADLGVNYVRSSTGLAHHDTLHGQQRLSDSTNPAKHQGLETFLAKYEWRMTEVERARFLDRAFELFAWRPVLPPTPAAPKAVRKPVTLARVVFVVGVIVDGDVPSRAMPLIDDLARLARHPRVDRVDVVLLENGSDAGFSRVVDRARFRALFPFVAGRDSHAAAARAADLDADDLAHRMSIAAARTLLHRFVFEVARLRDHPVVWILDDDARLPDQLDVFVDDVAHTREAGFDIAIGGVKGAPPIPAVAALRMQLVDLANFLVGASRRDPRETIPDTMRANARWRFERRDYYYDLARTETDRLETPFLPEIESQNLASAVAETLARVPRLLAGEQVFRPLHAPEDADPVAAAVPSSLRGGNTFVFDIDLLRDVPNLSPRILGRRTRRSDMIWAAVARFRKRRRVVSVPIVVAHDRTHDAAAGLDAEKLLDDVFGYAFFRALEKLLESRGPRAAEPFDAADRARVTKDLRKYAIERFAAFRLSFWRTRGVVRVLQRLLGPDGARPWWLDDERCKDGVPTLRTFLERLENNFTAEALHRGEQQLACGLGDGGFELFLRKLDEHEAARDAPHDSLTAWIKSERVDRAARTCNGITGREPDELLGVGSEGVVFRAGDRVVKVFDLWSADERAPNVRMLERLRLHPVPDALPRVLAIHAAGLDVVLETEFESSREYAGGEGPAVLGMLRALHDAGWVHTNLHPKNLRVSDRGLRVIDIGRSLEIETPVALERMIRRAFLSWRFSFRTDLRDLMRRSIEDTDLVELVGWRGLLEAVRGTSPKERLDEALASRVLELDPRRVLDYGCGKPRSIAKLAAGREMRVFDVDPSLAPLWSSAAPAIPFLDMQKLEVALAREERFDLVVCSLVLCAIDDTEMESVLERLRRLVTPDGRVLVAICDPTSVHVSATAFQRRRETAHRAYRERFAYSKSVGGTRQTRLEHHRPLDTYRRAFARAGFAIEDERAIDGIDADRFEPVAEFLMVELRRLPSLACRTSLLIGACAMEAETLAAQVEHLVSQLASPRAFDEVVLIIDSHDGPFPREHRGSDLARVRAEAERLRTAGVVDRVLEGPRDGADSAAIAERWFRLPARRAHARNGQPALAILDAIDACRGDLVLHVDLDVLVGKVGRGADPIAEAARTFDAFADAVTLALPVFGDVSTEPRHRDARGPFRVEVRSGWIHRARLATLSPLPNEVDSDGALVLPWHRSLDLVVQNGRASSLRKGSPRLWVCSPDNIRKNVIDDHMLLLDRVEAGVTLERQTGRSDQLGLRDEWCGPKRSESLVVVVCGRNVPAGRVRRCMESLSAQRGPNWGAVVMDDASDDGSHEVLRRACMTFGERVTLVRRRRRAGMLANIDVAVRLFVSDPNAVIVLVDLDDALGPVDALDTIAKAHAEGADLTVGTMVRTDKEIAYAVDFADPRTRRGGNVWQHVRTFRKSLFDRIDSADLKLDDEWVESANDWALMIPMVELAERPAWIRRSLYLHEPRGPRTPATREERESTIARLIARPSYCERKHGAIFRPDRLTVLCYHRIARDETQDATIGIYRRRGMVVGLSAFEEQMRAAGRMFEPVSLGDVAAAAQGRRSLPEHPLLVTFDECFSDFAELAFPFLDKSGIPAAIFARVPNSDGYPGWTPLDLLYHMLARANSNAPDLEATREAILRLPPSQQLAGVEAIATDLGIETTDLDHAYLRENTIRTLVAGGVALGAHGVNHVRLTELGDDELKRSLQKSAEWLSTRGALSCMAISYPDAALDDRVANAVAEVGFDIGFGLEQAFPSVAPRFAIRRFVARDDSGWIDSIVRSSMEAT